jgi:hypothetical protein
MKPDDPPPGAPATPEAPPSASLTNVRLRGRNPAEPSAKPPVKRGDLTQQLQADAPAAPPPEAPRTAPKRGDLTQQLEAAARNAAAAPAKPVAPPPQAKAEPERKAAKAEATPAPQRKAEPPVEANLAPPPKAEPPRKAAAAPPPERKPAAIKAEPPPAAGSVRLGQDDVDALFDSLPAPAAEPEPVPAKAELAPAPEAKVEAPAKAKAPAKAEPPRKAAAKAEPAPAKATVAPLPEPEAAESAPEAAREDIPVEAEVTPAADDPHANIPAGTELGEDDVRALLDPPARRRTVVAAEPIAEEAMPKIEAEDPPALAVEEHAEPEAPLAEEAVALEASRAEAAASEEAEIEAAPDRDAPDLHLVVDQSEPPAASEPAPAAAEAAAAPSNTIDQIIDYWDGLRVDRPYPILDAIDRPHISASWPNCLLVSFVSTTSTETSQPRMTRLGEANGQVEYTAMVIDWIIRCGRQSVKRGEPMEEEKRFPVTGGNARYQLLLLPLSSTEGKADYVLAHVVKVKELTAGAAFKRWLAS